MEFSKARAAGACVLMLWMAPVFALDDLTLAQALDAALKRNPELAASAFELAAATARREQAGLRPNTAVSLELENFAGSGVRRGTDALETTLALSQVIELGGKRAARLAVAEADLESSSLIQRARELDALAETTRRFIDAAAARERLTFARDAQRLAQETLAAIGRRVDAARSPIAERSRARIALTRAGIDLRQAERSARAARYQLAASFGDVEPQFADVRADLFSFDAGEPFNAWFERLARNPDLLRFASETRLRDAELRLAQSQARADLSVSLGVRHFADTGDNALVAGISMPIAWRDRNQGAVAAAHARRSQTGAEHTAALNRLRATLFALHSEADSARERAQTLRADALPQAREALRQTRSGYDVGRFSFLELASAQTELLELQQAAIDAAADHHRLRAELERLAGEASP
jgi:cobalt-zinc-cadmium efflux system outer membrane protein